MPAFCSSENISPASSGFWAITWMFPLLWLLVEHDTIRLRLLPSAVIGLGLGLGMLASFAHLGTKKNAWRVFANLRKSSLSREILFVCLFSVSWLFITIESVVRHQDSSELMAATRPRQMIAPANRPPFSPKMCLPAINATSSWPFNSSAGVVARKMALSST